MRAPHANANSGSTIGHGALPCNGCVSAHRRWPGASGGTGIALAVLSSGRYALDTGIVAVLTLIGTPAMLMIPYVTLVGLGLVLRRHYVQGLMTGALRG